MKVYWKNRNLVFNMGYKFRSSVVWLAGGGQNFQLHKKNSEYPQEITACQIL